VHPIAFGLGLTGASPKHYADGKASICVGDQRILDDEEILKNAVVVKSGFLLNCLKKRDTISKGSDPEVLTSGYVIQCTLDGIREDDFVGLIGNLIVPYALLKKE
jgi:hypothetical protein